MTGDGDGFDVDAFLDGYRPRTATVQVCQRSDLLDRHAELETELAGIGAQGDHAAAGEVVERITALEAEIAAAQASFTFEACSHADWYRLLAEHPATPEDQQAQPGAVVGREFQIQAVALCAKSPRLTVAQVRRMASEWRPDDFDRLWLAVVACNEGAVDAPKSALATAVRELLDQHSTNRKQRRSRGRSTGGGNGGQSRNTSTTKKRAG